MTITSFSGEYACLSNFYRPHTHLTYGMINYPTVEHAFQASKTLSLFKRSQISRLQTPQEAKGMGKGLTLRDDWEELKQGIMYMLILQKFNKNINLADILISTEGEELIEGNTWGDMEWGMVRIYGKWKGNNKLGKILMQVREELY